jgi:alginate O-acetyltransferase complex protein AlgI
MAFNSIAFLLFVCIAILLNYYCPHSYKRILLITLSLVFIAAFSLASAAAVVLMSGFTFIMGNAIVNGRSKFFYPSVFLNVMAIVVVAYIAKVHPAEGSVSFTRFTNLFFLVGLSFYGLQNIAYLIDIRHKRIQPAENFQFYLLASSYFPKIVCGPLMLFQEMKERLNAGRPSDEMIIRGMNRMALGYFKKMVLADRLAQNVNSVFDYPEALPGLTILAGACLFTIQLYFDFSGYTDIAIGVSFLLGITLKENFNFPLRSATVTMFWRRWHMTLIHFFTVYIYYPLSFRFRHLRKISVAIAVACTFLISAVWHGPGITFILWGICHVLYLLTEHYAGLRAAKIKDNPRIIKIFSSGIVFLLVSFSMIFFRATSVHECVRSFTQLTGEYIPGSLLRSFIAPLAVTGEQAGIFNLLLSLLLVSVTLVFERRIFALLDSSHINLFALFVLLISIFLFGVFDSGERFIYFQFG